MPRACNGELSLVYRKYQAGEKIQESSELRKEKVHNSGAFSLPKFLELSVTEAQSSLPVPVACVC